MYGIGISIPAAQVQGYNDNAYIVCNLPPFLLECWNSYQSFKKGGLTGPQLWEGVPGKEAGSFFQWGEGCNFYKKTKLKSEIFNDKKVRIQSGKF